MGAYKTIVAATDFSALSGLGVRAGLDLADRLGAERLHVVHVIQAARYDLVVPHTYAADTVEQIYARSHELANEKLEALDLLASGVQVTKEARLGSPALEIEKIGGEIDADLIVLASHGYGAFKRAFLGSVASTLIRMASCPVLIVGEARPGGRPVERVLAAVDLSPVSSDVLRRAIEMARPAGGIVHVLSLFEHPVVSYGEEALLPKYVNKEEMEALRIRQKEKVWELLKEIPHEGVEIVVEAMSRAPQGLVILQNASLLEADLVVVGTSGHNAWHRMIVGSTATRVIAEAPCPVLVVPHDV